MHAQRVRLDAVPPAAAGAYAAVADHYYAWAVRSGGMTPELRDIVRSAQENVSAPVIDAG